MENEDQRPKSLHGNQPTHFSSSINRRQTRPRYAIRLHQNAPPKSIGSIVALPDSFTITDLAATISKLLDLHEGNDVEIQRDRSNPNRIMVIKRVD
jgi:hypothetical protein